MAVNGNLPSTTENSTTDFFNNYYNFPDSISQNVDDAVLGYFQSITGDVDAGRNLAGCVIQTAIQQGIEPMSLIDEFRKLRPNELNTYLTMFLNFSRANTSLLGLSNSPQTNKYIRRAILP